MGWRSLQIWVVLVLSDHVPDAAEDDPGVLLDGGPHRGGLLSRANLASSPL